MRSRVFLSVLLLALLFSLVMIQVPTSARPPYAGTPAGGIQGVVVSSEPLRIRTRPSTTAPEAGSPLKPETSVTILGRNDIGTWLIVQTQTGIIGWVGSPYVAPRAGSSMKDVPVMDDNAAESLTAAAATAAPPEGTEGACPPTSGGTSAPLTGVKGVVVASDSLRIRTKPSSSAPEAGSPLKPDTPVTVLGRNDDGLWLVVQTQTGLLGWVGSAYVALLAGGAMKDVPVMDDSALDTLAAQMAATAGAPGACPPAGTPAATAAAPVSGVQGVVVSSDPLRIRTQPSTTSAEAGSPLKPGVSVTVLGRNGDGIWLYVQTETGLKGWVGSAYVALRAGGSMKDVPVLNDSGSAG